MGKQKPKEYIIRNADTESVGRIILEKSNVRVIADMLRTYCKYTLDEV